MITKGQKINDRYQIIQNIGEGGMANVYLAYDTILERNVAVKILRGDLSSDEKFVRRFQREALSASSLSHPNIVEVYDVGEDDGFYYIVMEYIEGKHLKQLLKKRSKLTVGEVVDIMLQLTDGMSCAHDSYIIHRDIKPQNVMILENGIVKITDFGVAMAMNSAQLTQTNSVMGSVHYLPPEQAAGKGSTIQSDIYSMGILMYELLTGTLPYKGDNAVEIALKHLKEPFPSLRKELPNIAVSIENIILKSIAKNPKNRYLDAREMHDDLMTCLDPARENEPLHTYSFPDAEVYASSKQDKLIEQTKEFKNVKNKKTVAGDEIMAKKITDKDLKKKENKLLLILGTIFASLAIITAVIVLLIPQLTSTKEVSVPDVSNKTVAEAIKVLKDKGLKIEGESKSAPSDTIAKGKVVKTYPGSGTTVKKGAKITLYESIGIEEYVLEDFAGKNYLEIKAVLERVNNLFVVIEKEEVTDVSNYEDGVIIKQEPASGTKVKAGDTITLYIPDISSVYPDFTSGNYSLTDIQAFCDKYNLILQTDYQQTDVYEEGAIIKQSFAPGSTIITGMTLKIVIAESPEVDFID